MKFKDVSTRRYSEAEIAAVAYTTLLRKLPEYYVRAGWKYVPEDSNLRGCVFDIAIFDANFNLSLIIEIKRAEKSRGHALKQQQRYQRLTGIRTIVVRGMTQAQYILPQVLTILRGSTL